LVRGRTEESVRHQLEEVGLPSDGVIEHTRGRKRHRTQSPASRGQDMDVDESDNEQEANKRTAKSRTRSISAVGRSNRSQSATRGSTLTSVAPRQQKQVQKGVKWLERKIWKEARAGEADRRHFPKLVKHLNSGKSSLGTSTIGR